MSVTLSKIILLIEAIVCVAPIGFLLVLFVPGVFAQLVTLQSTEGVGYAVFMTIPFLGGLSLMFSFWLHGVEGIRGERPYAWLAAYAGAALVIGSALLGLLALGIDALQPMAKPAMVFLFGTPLLVPLGHLMLECRFRPPAQPSLEP